FDELGQDVFKRWDGTRHTGKFLISGFDPIVYGVASNRAAIEQMEPATRSVWLRGKIKRLWGMHEFNANSGQGVRGTTRLTNLLPFGAEYFTP
ncbi:MAG: hypothetical protein Q7J74_07035, partial [Pseudomonas sp.]|nr:hypothetical protein [Pseudomonas sp.]